MRFTVVASPIRFHTLMDRATGAPPMHMRVMLSTGGVVVVVAVTQMSVPLPVTLPSLHLLAVNVAFNVVLRVKVRLWRGTRVRLTSHSCTSARLRTAPVALAFLSLIITASHTAWVSRGDQWHAW